MAEGKPPYGDIHPMRAIFMIPTKPPPSFREPDQWSPEFIDFVSRYGLLNVNQDVWRTSQRYLRLKTIRVYTNNIAFSSLFVWNLAKSDNQLACD